MASEPFIATSGMVRMACLAALPSISVCDSEDGTAHCWYQGCATSSLVPPPPPKTNGDGFGAQAGSPG
jgi:hypothetical protein